MSLNTQSLQPIINFQRTVADDVLVNTWQKGKHKDGTPESLAQLHRNI
jgi:type I restriction enzyme M protein